MATDNAQTKFKSIQDCPQFLRGLVAEQLGVTLETVTLWIDSGNSQGIERIEIAILEIDEAIKGLQRIAGGAS